MHTQDHVESARVKDALKEAVAKRDTDKRTSTRVLPSQRKRQLRGIPASAPGVGGTSPGTDPEHDTNLLDRREAIVRRLEVMRRARGDNTPVRLSRNQVHAIARAVQGNLDVAWRYGKLTANYARWKHLARHYIEHGYPDLAGSTESPVPGLLNVVETDPRNEDLKLATRLYVCDELKRNTAAQMTPKERSEWRNDCIAAAIRYYPADDRELSALFRHHKGFSKSQINRIRQTIPKEEQALYAAEMPTLVERVTALEAGRQEDRERIAALEREAGLPVGGLRATREAVEQLLAEVQRERAA